VGHQLVMMGWQSIWIVGAFACIILILLQKIQKIANKDMTFGYHPAGAPTYLRKQEVQKSNRNAAQPCAMAQGCVNDDLRADGLQKGCRFRVGTWNVDSLTGRAGEVVEALSDMQICTLTQIQPNQHSTTQLLQAGCPSCRKSYLVSQIQPSGCCYWKCTELSSGTGWLKQRNMVITHIWILLHLWWKVHIYTVAQNKPDPVTFSNNFQQILVNISNFLVQQIYSLQVCNMNFDETGYQLTLFSLQTSTLEDTSHRNGSEQRELHFIFKNLGVWIF